MLADASAGGKAERDDQYVKKIRESVDSLLGAVSEADRILLMLKEVEGLSLKELEKIQTRIELTGTSVWPNVQNELNR